MSYERVNRGIEDDAATGGHVLKGGLGKVEAATTPQNVSFDPPKTPSTFQRMLMSHIASMLIAKVRRHSSLVTSRIDSCSL
jgi:hypothetical protein